LLLIFGRILKHLENHIPLFWMMWKICNFLFRKALRMVLSHFQNNLFFLISAITITIKHPKAESSIMTQPWHLIGIFQRKNLLFQKRIYSFPLLRKLYTKPKKTDTVFKSRNGFILLN